MTISAWNGWDPLTEVWLGDCWPPEFFEYLKSDVRDTFQRISEMTREDLNKIQTFLEDRGITVRRPQILPNYENYIASNGALVKPPICPRDFGAVLGETLYVSDEEFYLFNARRTQSTWQPWIDYYRSQGHRVIQTGGVKISSANIVRLGRDLIWDDCFPKAYFDGTLNRREKMEMRYSKHRDFVDKVDPELTQQFRIHYTNNGGHADACLSPLRPGLLVGTKYWPFYEETMPGWETIMLLDKPEWHDHKWGNYFVKNPGQIKWFVPDHVNEVSMTFNKYVELYAKDWIGNYRETYFEVNMLVLDKNNVACIGEHPGLFKELESRGITPHVLPFRCRSFWDGGLHCITLDISRIGVCEDYWPERGLPGLGLNIDAKDAWE